MGRDRAERTCRLKPLPRALLNVILLIAVFAAIEFLASLAFKAGVATRSGKPAVLYPYHPYLGWEAARSTTFKGTLAGGLHDWKIDTDSLGRSITPYLNTSDPVVELAILGGSTMFGVGSSGNSTTVPSLIERELYRRTRLRIEVHNLAVGGYTSFQEMLSLERFMVTGRVDIVVSISGYNDAFAAAFEKGPEFGLLPDKVYPKADLVRSMERGELKVLPVAMSIFLGRLRRWFCAIDLLGKASDRIAPRQDQGAWARMPAPEGKEVEHRARWVMTNYAMMDALAKQNGARFFMFLQPTALTRKALVPAERQCLDSLDRAVVGRLWPVQKVFYDAVRGAEKRFAFYDITHCLDSLQGPAYADDAHYLDGGAGAVANAVCDVIVPVVLEAARERGVKSDHAP